MKRLQVDRGQTDTKNVAAEMQTPVHLQKKFDLHHKFDTIIGECN